MLKKKLILGIFLFFINFFGVLLVYGNSLSSKDPKDILEYMKSSVQNTALNNTDGKGFSDSLKQVKKNSSVYIEWLGFIGLSIALVLIIYNGIYLLANFTDENRFSKIKKRFVSLIIGVVVLTSGYIVIKFVVSIIGEIF